VTVLETVGRHEYTSVLPRRCKIRVERDLIKDRTDGKVALEWVHKATKHVKRSMGFVITDEVIQGTTRVAGR
jgi:hypothetical protein